MVWNALPGVTYSGKLSGLQSAACGRMPDISGAVDQKYGLQQNVGAVGTVLPMRELLG